MKNPRLIAFETLYKIFSENSYSNIALDNALNTDAYDKRFISALVYGVVERKLTLDYFIEKYTDTKLKPKILIILRMGVYQLLFMDKVPSSAAINESVKLTKEIKQGYYSSFVNAILHKVDADRDIPDIASVKYSVPNELINMWNKQYGEDKTHSFLSCINDRPPVFAVVNTLLTTSKELMTELEADGIRSAQFGDTGEMLKITSPFDLSKSDAFNRGLFYIEDASSYECAKALEAKPGEVILDMCSAPGGKAFASAIGMKNQGLIHSFDIHKSRLDMINESAERLSIDIIKTSVNDASKYNEEIPVADRVLCDVPCSGFGIIRRKPEIRYKNLDSIKSLPSLQLDILSTSSGYVKDNGTLLYSTCTLNKKENEKVVSAFLESNKNFSLVRDKTSFPSADGGDGFYYAVMVKNVS